MIKIRELEHTVSNLPEDDLSKFRTWFHKFDAIKWDRQLEGDVRAGKLDRIAQKAIRDFKNGKCKEL